MKATELRAMAAPWNNGVELLVVDGDAVGVNVVMEKKDPASMVDPTMRISRTSAQILMDDLWHAGFRPTEGTGSAGSLKATENHLHDMRRIAFKQLGLDDERRC